MIKNKEKKWVWYNEVFKIYFIPSNDLNCGTLFNLFVNY